LPISTLPKPSFPRNPLSPPPMMLSTTSRQKQIPSSSNSEKETVMSSLFSELSPEQWEAISNYEARSKITSLSKRKISMECENVFIVITKWRGQNLPRQIRDLSGDRAKLKRVSLSIDDPELFSVNSSVFDKNSNRHVTTSEGKEVILTKQWGEPHSGLNRYNIWGFLDWPCSSINEMIVGSKNKLKIKFEELDCFPVD
jgi:hypothetical protein